MRPKYFLTICYVPHPFISITATIFAEQPFFFFKWDIPVVLHTVLNKYQYVKNNWSVYGKINHTYSSCFHRFTVHSVDYLITRINTCTHAHTHTYIYIYYLRSLKFTLKHLKRSYMFRSHDHPQGAYTVPC